MNFKIIFQFFEKNQTHNWQYIDQTRGKKIHFFIDDKTARKEIELHDLKIVFRSFDGNVLKLVYA